MYNLLRTHMKIRAYHFFSTYLIFLMLIAQRTEYTKYADSVNNIKSVSFLQHSYDIPFFLKEDFASSYMKYIYMYYVYMFNLHVSLYIFDKGT